MQKGRIMRSIVTQRIKTIKTTITFEFKHRPMYFGSIIEIRQETETRLGKNISVPTTKSCQHFPNFFHFYWKLQ